MVQNTRSSTQEVVKNTANPGTALGLALGVTMTAVAVWLAAWQGTIAVQRSLTPGSPAISEVVAHTAQALPPLDAEAAGRGRDIFARTCAVCHGAVGQGGLGKELAHSNFVAKVSDPYLLNFLITGRSVTHELNTTKMPMPARGGNPDLTDDQLKEVVVFLRALQSPDRVPEGTLTPPTVLAGAAGPVAGGEFASPTGEEDELVTLGRERFTSSCSACHGPGGLGVPGMGKDLRHSQFVRGLDDDGLIAFIKKGRDANDPANTTKVAMPPKGGNPALNDEQMEEIVAFIRALQDADRAGAQ